MKRVVVIHLLFLMAIYPCLSQSKTKLKPKYRCVVVYNDGSQTIGMLYALNDSSLQILDIHQRKMASSSYSSWTFVEKQDYSFFHTIPVNHIKLIKFRKFGSVGTGVLVGSIIGMVSSGIILLSSFDKDSGVQNSTGTPFFSMDFDKEMFIIPTALYVGSLGAIVGALLGSGSKRYYIDGVQDTYELKRSEMRKYLVPQESDFADFLKINYFLNYEKGNVIFFRLYLKRLRPLLLYTKCAKCSSVQRKG